jgi:signal peptidase I
MKQTQHWSSIFFNLILLAGLVLVWIAFAPVKIGGQASYVMVNGISMEPNYHTGDMVVVRKEQAYQVGDVVAYRDALMGAYIIHRIIGTKQEKFIMKGDNNSWVDPYQPTHDEIVGKQWIYTPKAGRVMQWLRKPINLSLTIVLLGGVLMNTTFTKPSKGKKQKNSPSIKLGGMLESTLYLLGFLFIVFLGLSIFAFTRPSTRTADKIKYQQFGNYSYTATGTLGVYDSEMVRSGEPIFPKLTCFLNIGFTYNILGNQLQNTSGNSQMYARVMDAQSGWQRTIPIIPQTAFTGNSYSSMAALDLCQVTSLLDLVEKETGLRASTYTLEIVTNIAFTSNASGQAITDTFDPILTFKYDKVHLYLANTKNETDPMGITKEGLASNSNMQSNTLSILGRNFSVDSIRVFALLGLVISLCGLIITGLFVLNTASQSEDALIRLRFGSMLVDVYEKSLEPTSTTIDVTSMEDLAKLAERQGTMILHMTYNFLHYYLVQNNGTTYRYIISTGKKGIIENDTDISVLQKTTVHIEENELPTEKPVHLKAQRHSTTVSTENDNRPYPVQNKISEYTLNRLENKFIEKKQPVSKKMTEYIIHTGEIGFVMKQPETEMLKKIRI